MPKTDGICVANHTSPIDVVILSVDRPYALVGQSHPGFMGIFQVETEVKIQRIKFELFRKVCREELLTFGFRGLRPRTDSRWRGG